MIDDHHSPMFLHALESFEHGIFHYLQGGDKDRKFAFLHLDQAVELLLKEKVVRLGRSIYKSDGTTLNIHEIFKSLENAGVKLEERARLEEVHDLRNIIQHKGITPDKSATEFCAKVVYNFVKRFLREQLDTSLDGYISVEDRKKMEGIKDVLSLAEATHAIIEIFEKKPLTPEETAIANFFMLQGFLAGQRKKGEEKAFMVALRRIILERGLEFQDYKRDVFDILAIRDKVLRQGEQLSEREAEQFERKMLRILRALGADIAPNS